MNFKIDPEFEKYWPKLSPEKLSVLEASIVEEGLRENLVVWKERGILIDGHQRFSILRKHKISIDGKITFLSFPDALSAKRWIHTSQIGRRGDVPIFLNILHVLEFEPIYRDQAKERQREHGKTAPGRKKDHFLLDYQEVKGESVSFMKKDSGVGESSIRHVLFIRDNYPKRFAKLSERAKKGENIPIESEYYKAKAFKRSEEKGFELDEESLNQLTAKETIVPFIESVDKYRPSIEVQKKATEAIADEKKRKKVDEIFVEDQFVKELLPKKKRAEGAKSDLEIALEMMNDLAKYVSKALAKGRLILELRKRIGEEVYFEALSRSIALQGAFAEWGIQLNEIKNKGGHNENGKRKRLSYSRSEEARS